MAIMVDDLHIEADCPTCQCLRLYTVLFQRTMPRTELEATTNLADPTHADYPKSLSLGVEGRLDARFEFPCENVHTIMREPKKKTERDKMDYLHELASLRN
jgi:hypothetical protein